MDWKFLVYTLVWRRLSVNTEALAALTNLKQRAFEPKSIKLFAGLDVTKNECSKFLEIAIKEWSYCREHKIKYCFKGDANYPYGFNQLEEPPLFFTYQGKACWQDARMLSIVGSRNPNTKVLEWLESEMPSLLRANNLIVVSGGARGVDQKAHQMSLRVGVPTICFVPSGLGCIYPSQLSSWVSFIVDQGGCIISTYSPFQKMLKFHFYERNKLIAAISNGLVVGEARRRSGTLMTARFAMNMNRPVMVLPSSPMDGACGGLDLIFDGALMVRDGADISLALSSF